MPKDRQILQNVVNNDQKVGNIDAKPLANDLKAGMKDVKKPGGHKWVKKTATIKEAKKENGSNEEKLDEKMVFEDITNKTTQISMANDPVLAIDEGDEDNPHLMCEYAADIYGYLRVLENKYSIRENFMSEQSELNPRMRGILVNWLVQVHSRFHLLQETLFSTVSILDHYLQRSPVPKTRFQLVGITALWLASKTEEIYVASIDDYLYVTDNAYTKKDMEEMELAIVTELNFEINMPLSIHFLRRYSKAATVDVQVHNLAKFLIEFSLSDYNLTPVPSSQLAAAALRLSRTIHQEPVWTNNLTYHSTYSDADILPVVCKLARLLTTMSTSKFTATLHKYASSKFFNISRSEKLKSDVVLQLAAME